MKFDGTNIKDVLEAHERWMSGAENDDDRACFSGCDLRGMYFAGVSLYGADFRGADLHNAVLCHCDLRKADFTGANFYRTDFYCSQTDGARGIYFPLACPSEGSFVAFKRARAFDEETGEVGQAVILKLLIPEDAQRLSDTERACWASKAKVLEIQTMDGEKLDISCAVSMRDTTYLYKVGQTAVASGFNTQRTAHREGIYFFLDRRECTSYWDIYDMRQAIKKNEPDKQIEGMVEYLNGGS